MKKKFSRKRDTKKKMQTLLKAYSLGVPGVAQLVGCPTLVFSSGHGLMGHGIKPHGVLCLEESPLEDSLPLSHPSLAYLHIKSKV